MSGLPADTYEVFSVVLEDEEDKRRIFVNKDQLLALAGVSELRARKPSQPTSSTRGGEVPARGRQRRA